MQSIQVVHPRTALKRSEHLSTRVRPHEKDEVRGAALHARQPLAEFVRDAVLATARLINERYEAEA